LYYSSTTGLTTGEVFVPIISAGLPDYSQPNTIGYDIFANQGILNSTAGTVTTVNNNTQTTALAAGTPTIVDLNVSAVQQAGVRFSVNATTGRSTYIGSKQIYVSVHCSFSFLKQDKGTDDYTFYIAKNGTIESASGITLPDLDDLAGSGNLVYGLLLNTNDYLELYVESTAGDDIDVFDYVMLVRE